MDRQMAPHGPFKIELQVMLIAEKGSEFEGLDAWATIELAAGRIPSAAEIASAIEASTKSAPDGFRTPNRHEFLSALMADKVGGGMTFAVPGPREFTPASDQPA